MAYSFKICHSCGTNRANKYAFCSVFASLSLSKWSPNTKKHANMLGFFVVFSYNYKIKLLVSHVGLFLFGFQNQTAELYKIGLTDE